MDKILNIITSAIITLIIITTIINVISIGFPIPVFSKKNDNSEYIISKSNIIDFGNEKESAAFSVAYIMRHFGIAAKGGEIQKMFSNETKQGHIYPKDILSMLEKNNIHAKYCVGNYNTFKNEIDKGIPIIALVKDKKDNKEILYYVPVVGYDEESVYLAESIEELSNTEELYYNREMKISEFKKIWNTRSITMPLYSNTFIKIEYYNEFLR